MKAMVLTEVGRPLEAVERDDPVPGPGEVRLKILACGVCRTDLHVVDGELPDIRTTDHPRPRDRRRGRGGRARASAAARSAQRVGVPWLGRTCGVCRFCRAGRENLCDTPLFTGYTRDGGYADHTRRRRRASPSAGRGAHDDADAAPLLCAGLIGWRCSGWPARRDGAWASTASARPPTSSRRWRAGRGGGVRLHAAGRRDSAGVRAVARRRLGRRLGRDAAGAAGCGDHLRAGRRARSRGAEGGDARAAAWSAAAST